MKTKLFLLAGLLFFFTNIANARYVSINEAKKIAKNFYYERVNQINPVKYEEIVLSETYIEINSTDTIYYVFNIGEDKGFIIISADDVTAPVLGYSFTGSYSTEGQPPAFQSLMNNFSEQIIYAKKNNLKATGEIDKQWQELNYSFSKDKSIKSIKTVTPLLLVEWGQGTYYNEQCPEDIDGPGGHVVVGCVAVAMAQVMKYYNYPQQGVGSHTNWSNIATYGLLTANFGSTTYQWSNMPNSLTVSNEPVAMLLYHCGIAVDMYYSPDGSSSATDNTMYALEDYFKYSSSIQYIEKYSYSDTGWKNILKNELDNFRPVIYAGSPETGAGHAFNCDGYQDTDYFHFNWGWSGAYDGYFYLDNLNPGGNYFSYYQHAVIGIYPEANYPEYCSGTKNINGREGTFNDGSGNQDYQNNIDCKWLIQPECGNYIELSFDVFDIKANDTVYIYDGQSTSDDLIDKFSEGDITYTINSSGNSLLVRFTSDNNNTSKGWAISYETEFCLGTVTITDPNGTISDGSGVCDYEVTTLCKWIIQPPGAVSVSLTFTEFDLANDAGDWVRIYKGSTTNLVEEFSYSNIPSSLTVDSGIVIVRFYSNTSLIAGGWTANYTSVITQINDLSDNINALNLHIFPNPFSNDTKIIYELPENSNITITVTDIIGKLTGIFTEEQAKGNYDLNLSDIVSDIENGIYFINIMTNNYSVTRKVVCIIK